MGQGHRPAALGPLRHVTTPPRVGVAMVTARDEREGECEITMGRGEECVISPRAIQRSKKISGI